MLNQLRLVAVLLVAASLVACSSADQWTTETVDPDGVRVVDNGPFPDQWTGSLPILTLLDVWHIEGWDGGLFGRRPSRPFLSVSPSEDIGVAERDPPALHIFDSDGHHLWQVGRSGAGPGEFATPRLLEVHPELGWILSEAMTPRIHIFDFWGNLVNTKTLAQLPRAQWHRGFYLGESRSVWYYASESVTRGNEHAFDYHLYWTNLDTIDAIRVATFEHPSNQTRGNRRYLPWEHPTVLEVDGGGNAWTCFDIDYEIDVYSSGGEDHWRIRKQAQDVDFDRAYRERIAEEWLWERDGTREYILLPEHQPHIAAMNWTADNEMWVFTSTWVDSPLVQIDVFTAEGKYVRAFLADRSLSGAWIGGGIIVRGATAVDGSPLLVKSKYSFDRGRQALER